MTRPAVTADAYARWRATTLGRLTERAETDVVFGLTGPLGGKRVLDVGTGDGTYALEAVTRGARVTAVDAVQGMLDAARARAEARGTSIVLRKGRAEELPFDGGAFDLVLAVTVLCFVPAASTAVREMARVLAPGGRLVLGELGRYSLWSAERRVRGWLGSETWRSAHFWSRRALTGLARDARLRVADVRGAIFFPPIVLAARVMAPLDPLLTRAHAPGAAFLALAADKPRG
ncbi:MAG: class I SAM-dependent methyltransferase [Deltaproteobacteria bacterium]|nr:class I SAM-dependent methyltransferase [Deltaproteobacteria bacterium]